MDILKYSGNVEIAASDEMQLIKSFDINESEIKNNIISKWGVFLARNKSFVENKNIFLSNGKINQDYCFQFNIDELGVSDNVEYSFEGLDTFGLRFDSDTNEIKGIPVIAGEHKIKLIIKINDWGDGKLLLEKELTLIINPDPKSLWKNIPTPNDIEYFKPDSDKCFVKAESVHRSWMGGEKRITKQVIVAASQRGRSHAQEGKPRDDDFGLHYIKEHDWYIMTVADGAGSAKSSRKGSEIACKTVVDVCTSKIIEKLTEFENQIIEFNSDKTNRKRIVDSLWEILGNAVFISVKNIDKEARLANRPIKDYATTLIVSICKKFKFGWFVGAFWVGDGGIGIYDKDNQLLKVLGESDGGEYAGQTRFLTMSEITQPPELYRRLRFEIVEEFTALILMTDGITDPKFETDANLLRVEKWNELWNDLSTEVNFSHDNEDSSEQLLNWLDFWAPGNHDDRTIAILY